jgi:glucosamine-6-phosphate deaminase
MRVILTADRAAMGAWVAEQAAADLRSAIASAGHARLVIATGASQFEVLDSLASRNDVDWPAVTGFHLDEYIGISQQHGASFCRYLRERFVSKVPLRDFHYLNGESDAEQTIATIGAKLTEAPIDVALVGIGENGHLAFNDPPADFETDSPYIIVELDEKCRQQQVGEGWFASLADVPQRAISMSIRQIMRSKVIYCSVPDERKAAAVRDTLEGPITPQVPASILRQHSRATLIIDTPAASLLSDQSRSALEQV